MRQGVVVVTLTKYLYIIALGLATYIIYDQIFSAKLSMEAALSDFKNTFTSKQLSIVDIKNRASDYENIVDKYCTSSSMQNANQFMIDELLKISLSDGSALGRLLKTSPPISNSTNYSRDFLIYYKLSRMFESTLEQIDIEYNQSAEMIAFNAATDKAISKKFTANDFTDEEYENVHAYLSSLQCGFAKIYLGVIGQDEDFVRHIKSIQSEIVVKNVQEANKALEQIESTLGSN